MFSPSKSSCKLNLTAVAALLVLAAFGQRALAAPDKDVWAAVELGSSGVKVVVLKIAQGGETAAVEFLDGQSTPAEILKNAKPKEPLSAAQINRSIDAIEDMLKIARKYEVPDERIYLMISSGVAGLDAPNMNDLLAKIEGLIKIKDSGRLVMVKTAQEEVQYTIETVITDRKDRDNVMYVDIGGGNTKFGTMTKDGKVAFGSVKFGSSSLPTAAKLKYADPGFLDAIKGLQPTVIAAITKELQDKNLTVPPTIYLGGGASWTMAVLQKQWTGGQARAEVNPAEIDAFATRMQENKADLYAFKKGEDKEVNKEQSKALNDIRDAFRDPEKMVAASVMVQCVSNALEFKKGKTVYFVPDSHLKWLEGYVIKQQIGDKKWVWGKASPPADPQQEIAGLKATIAELKATIVELQRQLAKTQDKDISELLKVIAGYLKVLTERPTTPSPETQLQPIVEELKKIRESLDQNRRPIPPGPTFLDSPKKAGATAHHFYRGLDAYRDGKFEQALIHFDAATRIDPQDAASWYGLALAQHKLRLDEAARMSAWKIAVAYDQNQRSLSLVGTAFEPVQGADRAIVNLYVQKALDALRQGHHYDPDYALTASH